MDNTQEEFYTIKELAAKLKVCPNTVRAMIKRRTIAALRVGNQWRITATDLDTYLRETRQPGEASRGPQRIQKKPLTGPKHHKQAIFGADTDADDLFA